MINFKNIVKVLLMAMFICAVSGEVRAQQRPQMVGIVDVDWDTSGDIDRKGAPNAVLSLGSSNPTRDKYDTMQQCNPACKSGENCSKGKCVAVQTSGGGGENSANFCGNDFGIFSSLVKTGQTIFQRLRDLIYVVAGFGIIAVAVGGFFGNLNWKWLGAIVISLVVIATAGELIVLVTGCEQFGSSLITNTLQNPTEMSQAEYQDNFTEAGEPGGPIQWNDTYAKAHPETYAGTNATASSEDYNDNFMDGYDVTSDNDDYHGDVLDGMRVNSKRIEERLNKAAEDSFNNAFGNKQPQVQPAIKLDLKL